MIVFYNKPNLLILPYVDPEKKENRKFKFVPGNNTIEKEVWLAIRQAHPNSIDYYDTLLKVFQPIVDEETKEVVGVPEDEIDYTRLNIREMAELIDNTMDRKELLNLKKLEKERAKPRNTVKKLIKEKLKQINAIEEAIKD